jgi:hypothetical protein
MRRVFLAATLFLAACGGIQPGTPVTPAAGHAALQRTNAAGLDIPPRLQWAGNYGYCGEVSMISAGLYYGQYTSQYDARAIASPGIKQYAENSQLLLGVNDTSAARKMHLDAIEWPTASEKSTDAFLAWVKHEVALGYPVAIGVYTNEWLFNANPHPSAGQQDYDHVVPVTAVSSNHSPLDPAFYPSDLLTFSDNGLWNPSDKNPTYVFTYRFGAFEKTRAQANARDGTIYSTASDGQNYGIALTGVIDQNHETLPVRVSTSVNYERPAIVNRTSVRPAARPLVLTVTVSELRPGVRYTLYRYDRFTSVPNARFNANAGRSARRWSIRIASGSTYSLSERIMSDQSTIYRAVRVGAP